MKFATGVVLLVLIQLVLGDVYMHNPRGSNDRNCEKNVNRQNANRLFDSQNNAKGGYACAYPDHHKMYYYSGSYLPVEWTAQHGCGNGRTKCDIILQYMCEDSIRDGYPGKGNNNEGTDRIPEDPNASDSFGMHENYAYYQLAKDTQRNKGLYTADRNVRDGVGCTATRQNENGDRHGFEVPEERDYYPYWRASPWVDIAIFTDTSRCKYYKDESQNVKPRYYCKKLNDQVKYKKGNWPNNEADCKKLNQTWEVVPAFNLPPPECLPIPVSRENQLGNVRDSMPTPMQYNWTIPTLPKESKCVLRIRYNISVADFNGHPPQPFIDYRYNGTNSPITQDPFVTYAGNTLSIKANTNQIGRTFQDRSYVFLVRPRPANLQGAMIFNLNVRGKRGNIVQTYPAVEYDFIPNRLRVQPNDYVHFQWVGSNYNPQRGPNDAEGGPFDEDPNQNARADRNNLCEVAPQAQSSGQEKLGVARQYPLANKTQLAQITMFVNSDGTPDWNTIKKLSYLGQTDCLTLKELQDNDKKRNRERDPRNCAKINTKNPWFDGGVVQMRKSGTFHYICSRNNNFSNRDQKGTITVGTAKRSMEQDDLPWLLPEDVIKVDGDVSIDNPSIDEQYTTQTRRATLVIPPSAADNDMIGTGNPISPATVKEASKAIFQSAAASLAETTGSTPPPVTTTSSSGGLSSGAVAGIAIGCVIGGLLIGVLIAFVLFRR